MQNPQTHHSNSMILPRQMHKYRTGANIHWNMSEYQTPSPSFDQRKVVRERQYAAQKKGVKLNDFYITKRGFYLDYHDKVAAGIPASNVYIKHQQWAKEPRELGEEELASQRSAKKFTYLERIEMEESNRSKPGVGSYDVTMSLKDLEAKKDKLKEKKVNQGEKRYFYEDTEHLSARSPGMGSYNPHLSVDNIRPNKTDHKFWTAKHKKIESLNRSRDSIKPNPATYSPNSTKQLSTTFQKTFSLPKKDKEKKNGFGSDARFPYVRPNKKVIPEKRPAPTSYETKIEWKGKGNISPRKKRWADIIYTGSPGKVYH